MTTFEIVGGIVMILLSVAIALLVLMQESTKGGGMAALGGSDSFFNKNQGRSTEMILYKLTKYAAILFILVTIGVYALDVLVS